MKLYIDTTSVRPVVSDLKSIGKELGQADNEINSVCNSFKTLRVYNNVYRNTIRTQNNIEGLINTLARMEDGLEQAINYYLRCEQRIVNEATGGAAQIRSQQESSCQKTENVFANWWNDFISSWGIGNSDKAKEVRNDKAMAKELKKLLKNDRYNKKNWKKASVEERKEILKELFEDMKKIYGIDVSQINIEPIESEPGYTTYGYLSYYRSGSMEMTINEDILRDAGNYDTVMDTMAHELRHGYQHSVVDNPEQYEVSEETMQKWKDNFNDYKTTDEDGYGAYRSQPVEKDARKFAGRVV